MPAKLLPRKKAFALCPALAWSVGRAQRFEWKQLKAELPTMALSRAAKAAEKARYAKSLDDLPSVRRKYTEGFFGIAAEPTPSAYRKELVRRFGKLAERLAWEGVVVLPQTKASWFGLPNSHRVAKASKSHLQKLGIGKSFTGALHLSGASLAPTLHALCAHIPAHPELPHYVFTAPGKPFTAVLCHRLNFHLEFYEERYRAEFTQAALAVGMIEDANCENRIWQGSILGRRLVLTSATD